MGPRQRNPSRRARFGPAGVVAGLAAVVALAAGFVSSGASGAGPAPACGRVDLATPKFSNPTSITNPLFPKSEDGVIVDHDGTWLAGKDGPPGMIMPADPRVCDVYRPENIPGFVFEEATVTSVGQTVDGPRGPVSGAISIQARLMDGTVEEKLYAPGYGEFQAQVVSVDELYSVALAVPIDARPGAVPQELSKLSSGTAEIFKLAANKKWDRVTATLELMHTAWTTYRAGGVPEQLDRQMSDTLDVLDAAVEARQRDDVRQAAIDVGQATLDLQLQYRPLASIDRARLRLWQSQLQLDRAAGDSAGVAGDLATLEAIENRLGAD